jgi:F0F1-type ATP synthase membrane subunit c/vacuolar-type H+-ATPase subunit K
MLGTMKKHPILTGMAGMGAGYGAGTLMSSGVRDPGMAPQQRYQQGGF